MVLLPNWFLGAVAFILGITIGSFLNAVIYRLPRGLSLLEPKFSICPHCKHQLGVLDLIPLFSFLLLRGRCRYCRETISWRYFGVELLTGGLFVLVTLRFWPEGALPCIALLAVTAVLVPVFFIDLATFTIPDTLNILLFLIPLGLEILRWRSYPLVDGWMPPALWGGLIGGLLFGAIRLLGWLWKGVEAMGLGDVLLARGMGAILALQVPNGENPLRLLPIWVLFSCLSGVVVGPLLILYRRRCEKNGIANPTPPLEEASPPTENEGHLTTLLAEMGAIIWCLLLGDLWAYLLEKWRRRTGDGVQSAVYLEDNWVPAPTAIPFGPFLVIGFLLTLLWGEALTNAYLAYAFRR